MGSGRFGRRVLKRLIVLSACPSVSLSSVAGILSVAGCFLACDGSPSATGAPPDGGVESSVSAEDAGESVPEASDGADDVRDAAMDANDASDIADGPIADGGASEAGSSGPCSRTVSVDSTNGLDAAIKAAMPGDCIVVADGSYGAITMGAAGTSTAPIVVEAAHSLQAVFTAGIKLEQASWVVVQGFAFASAPAVTIDDSKNCRLTRSQIKATMGTWIVVQGIERFHPYRSLRYRWGNDERRRHWSDRPGDEHAPRSQLHSRSFRAQHGGPRLLRRRQRGR
jgi:hypothetical protein